jgi:hypothetical protein
MYNIDEKVNKYRIKWLEHAGRVSTKENSAI